MINTVCGITSTGRICTDLAQRLDECGNEVKIVYGRGNVPDQFRKFAVRIGNEPNVNIDGIKTRIFDNAGFNSAKVTRKLILWIKDYDPDVIHLHNLHGYYINVEILFDYLRTSGKTIFWTLHDCWPITGHCAYFSNIGCNEWVSGCKKCPQKEVYPKCIGISKSSRNYLKKEKIFTSVPNMHIIVPSIWLSKIVRQSFLQKYPITVIYNGIDTKIFTNTSSNLKEQYHIEDKKIVLGVASVWDSRKGLNHFIELSKLLPDGYKIVLIGLTSKQIAALPDNIIGISRTNSIMELVKWYSTASVFVNPTLEDNYPTTNLEAISCGTPVITYDTGGSPESARLFGCVTEHKNVQDIANAILENQFSKEIGSIDFSIQNMFNHYLIQYKLQNR